jgi:tRNA pseudouridine55 synthase
VFEAECGKGTYVRALVRDIGRALGCLSHVIALRRTRVGPFEERHAVTIEELEERAGKGGAAALAEILLPIETALGGLEPLSVSQADAARLANGQPILLRGRDAPILSGPAFATSRGQLIAICEIEAGEMRPSRVFNWT